MIEYECNSTFKRQRITNQTSNVILFIFIVVLFRFAAAPIRYFIICYYFTFYIHSVYLQVKYVYYELRVSCVVCLNSVKYDTAVLKTCNNDTYKQQISDVYFLYFFTFSYTVQFYAVKFINRCNSDKCHDISITRVYVSRDTTKNP